MDEGKRKSMDGRTTSVVGVGCQVTLDDPKDEDLDELCYVEQGSENSNIGSSISSELTEDSTSSSSSSSVILLGCFVRVFGPHANLPIKRGLSGYYDGKSQSFTCLGRAKSLEDLIKNDHHFPYNKRMKYCKTYMANVDIADPQHCRAKRSYSPRAMMSKKGNRNYTSLFQSTTSIRVAASSSCTIDAIRNLGLKVKD